jgi:DNA polymerase elongation subunit (family B)
MTTPNRLFFDIETSPNIGMFWESGYKKNISYDNIIKERAIICICYKWQNKKEVYSLHWDAQQCDKTMLQKFIEVANQSDELVGHNGDKFDLAWIRTRCLFHGIDMFPIYATIDTLKQARSKFKFNSNKLDYIAKYLGFDGKIKTTFNLWKDILLHKDKKAMKDMIEYCCEDVVILEKVFLKMAGHIPNKMHHGILQGGKRLGCRECGSTNMTIVKNRISVNGIQKAQVQCNECGKYITVPKKDIDYYI